MKFLSCSIALMLLLAPLTHAAAKRTGEDSAAPALVAAVDLSVTRLTAAGVDARPVSAGVAASLPDGPAVSPVAFRVPTGEPFPVAAKNVPVAAALPDDAGVSTLEASPLRVAAHKVRAERFNTDDGVRVDDFAICYRLNGRSSIQLIPGDPAPVKMPVSTMANNTGVTVGMVVRLSRRP